MEQKEFTEKSGIAFKELFIVFKRLWILLLALVLACAVFFSWNDKRTHAPYTYTAKTTLQLDINNTSNAESYITAIKSIMNLSLFREDVTSKKMEKIFIDKDRYDYVEDKYWQYVSLNGYYWLNYSEDSIMFEVYYSTTVSANVAKYTLKQIVLSIMNFTNMEDDNGGYQLKNLADIVRWPEEDVYQDQTIYGTPYSNSRAFIIGIFVGLILSAIIVLFVYKLDDTVKTKEELERLTGALFITYVEDIKEDKGGSRR